MENKEIRESIVLENAGQKLFAIIHKPKSLILKSYPAVVFCAGFAGSKCGKYRLYVRLSQALAEAGIVSLRFDYRGSGDSEGDFLDQTMESQVSDTLCCLNYLKNLSFINPEKIGVFGRSLGGMIAIMTLQSFSQVKSLVLWAPVFTPKPWKLMMQSQILNKSNLSAIEKSSQNLIKIKPSDQFIHQFFQVDLVPLLKNLTSIPLLHIQSQQDLIVTSEHQRSFQRERAGLSNSRFIDLKLSDHEFSDVEEQKLAINETVHWFQETL